MRFHSVPLQRIGTALAGGIPDTSVTEQGLQYYVDVENSGIISTNPADAPDSLFSQAVEPPRSILAVPQPTSGSEFLQRSGINVRVSLPIGAKFISGTLYHRPVGDREFHSEVLTVGEPLREPLAAIPATAVGSSGVEYWIDVKTSSRASTTFPALQANTLPATIRTTLQTIADPVRHSSRRYRIMTVPLDYGPRRRVDSRAAIRVRAFASARPASRDSSRRPWRRRRDRRR